MESQESQLRELEEKICDLSGISKNDLEQVLYMLSRPTESSLLKIIVDQGDTIKNKQKLLNSMLQYAQLKTPTNSSNIKQTVDQVWQSILNEADPSDILNLNDSHSSNTSIRNMDALNASNASSATNGTFIQDSIADQVYRSRSFQEQQRDVLNEIVEFAHLFDMSGASAQQVQSISQLLDEIESLDDTLAVQNQSLIQSDSSQYLSLNQSELSQNSAEQQQQLILQAFDGIINQRQQPVPQQAAGQPQAAEAQAAQSTQQVDPEELRRQKLSEFKRLIETSGSVNLTNLLQQHANQYIPQEQILSRLGFNQQPQFQLRNQIEREPIKELLKKYDETQRSFYAGPSNSKLYNLVQLELRNRRLYSIYDR